MGAGARLPRVAPEMTEGAEGACGGAGAAAGARIGCGDGDGVKSGKRPNH